MTNEISFRAFFGEPGPALREIYRELEDDRGAFIQSYEQEFKLTPEEIKNAEFVRSYCLRLEAYDQHVCSFRDEDGVAIPANVHERNLIGIHAVQVAREFELYYGFRIGEHMQERRRYEISQAAREDLKTVYIDPKHRLR